MQRISDFFIFCSGADPELLAQCKTESNRYRGIGATIFFTGLFAAISCGYALFTVFDNIWLSIIFAILWGLMIFNLDRYIVSSMRKCGKGGKQILMALPRLVIAVLISIVIAKPLELKIFEKEINAELVVMTQEKFLEQEQKVRVRFDSTQLALRAEIESLQSAIETQREKRDALVIAAQSEADGTGGSKRRNPGPIYKIKKADADRAVEGWNRLNAINSERIKYLQERIVANEEQIKNEIVASGRKALDGFAARLEAIDRITTRSSAIFIAHIFILLLFIVIETAPVVVKLISNKGPYDNLLNIEEHAFFTRETEVVSFNNHSLREKSATLNDKEKIFVSQQLDHSLNRFT